MRISDWSSDVCSSDLPAIEHTCTPPGMAVVDQTLEFLLLVRSRLRHYEYPCEPGHYLPGWIYILIMDACRGQIGNQGFHRRGYFGSARDERSEEHTSELQSLMRISYAVFCLKKKKH